MHPLSDRLFPKNEEDGILCGCWRCRDRLFPKKRQAFVRPKLLSPTQEPAPGGGWVAYLVHSRCWELLTYHDLGVIAEKDLGIVLSALRDGYKRTGYRRRAMVWDGMVRREG
jgi:hypothetical protein